MKYTCNHEDNCSIKKICDIQANSYEEMWH